MQNKQSDELAGLRKKFKEDMEEIYAAMGNHGNINDAIDTIFNQTTDLNEIESKLLLMVFEYAEKTDHSYGNVKKLNNQRVKKIISALSNHILSSQIRQNQQGTEEELEVDGVLVDKNNVIHLTGRAKRDFKETLKRYVIYEIYKILNPRRIAGESLIDNCRHNLTTGGIKKAEKYSGGTKYNIQKILKNGKLPNKIFKNNNFSR